MILQPSRELPGGRAIRLERFARVGEPRCPDHDLPLAAQTVSQMVDQVLAMPEGSKLMLLAPVMRERKGEHLALLDELRAQGFVRARINGRVHDLDEAPALEKNRKHTIEVVVDRFKVREDLQLRLAESFETCLNLADGIAIIAPMDGEEGQETTFSAKFACSSSEAGTGAAVDAAAGAGLGSGTRSSLLQKFWRSLVRLVWPEPSAFIT